MKFGFDIDLPLFTVTTVERDEKKIGRANTRSPNLSRFLVSRGNVKSA